MNLQQDAAHYWRIRHIQNASAVAGLSNWICAGKCMFTMFVTFFRAIFSKVKLLIHSEVTIEVLAESREWAAVSNTKSKNPLRLIHKKPFVIPRDKKGFDGFVSLSWAYDEEGSSRLPTQEEQVFIDEWTDRIKEKFEHDGASFLLLSMSSDGLQQWVLMTKKPDTAQFELIDAMGGNERVKAFLGGRYPAFEFSLVHDVEWTHMQQVQKIIQRNT
ncbi:DUF695 domain-containing protein [Andreprevotia chitinilytica]|uniref:DUF695 domain-containing protein n=1 Tax=Andreprevotia chitinilytica TaxID=396808 RepID=UPI000553656E|nr:DUF695 domain-containing protein [Andreprevotia chitinilytica]